MRERLFKVLVPCLSALFCFLALEVTARVYGDNFEIRNNLGAERSLLESAYPAVYSAELGWIPEPGASGAENIWHTEVTILRDGIRSNGGAEAPVTPAAQATGVRRDLIVAVGDSYTFGDQVSDRDTWPAALERLSGRRTLNGGVFGYGIDQSYLRARRLIEAYRPGIVILGLIPDDIDRCELSERTSAAKPFFALANGDLVLRNTPVPPHRPDGPADRLFQRTKELLSYSYLVHALMSKAFRQAWYQKRWRSTRVHADGERVSCLLLAELEAFAAAHGAQLYVLVQYVKDEAFDPAVLAKVDRVLACLEGTSARVIDLRAAFAEVEAVDSARFEDFFDGHMTPLGNAFVAEQVHRALQAASAPGGV